MTILIYIYWVSCSSSLASLGWIAIFANWTPELVTAAFAAAASLVAAVAAGIVAVLNARTRGRIEEQRAQLEAQLAVSRMNHEKLDELHVEMVRNTAETQQAKVEVKASVDQAKVRVEELHQSMNDASGHVGATGEKGPRGDKGEKGEKGDRGNGH